MAAAEVVPDLQGLGGVASVDLAGGLTSRLVVTLDPLKMAAAGVSIDQVEGVLTANNLTLPAGQLSTDGTQIPVSTSGSLTSVDQVSGLVVGLLRRQPLLDQVPAQRVHFALRLLLRLQQHLVQAATRFQFRDHFRAEFPPVPLGQAAVLCQ